MREMMRNTDRAMSNIESHPEGFNLLRRMYTNVQEPLMNATTSNIQANNPFSALFGNNTNGVNQQQQQQDNTPPPSNPNTAPLPNPWGSSSPTIPSSSPSNNSVPNTTSPSVPPIDPNLMSSMMQNPGVQNMMQQMFSNPEFIQQTLSTNPALSSMLNQNPMARQMFSNPEFLRQMSDPNTLNALMQMQSAMQQLQGSPLMNLLNPFSGENSNNLFGVPPQNPQQPQQPPQPPQPPEEKYKIQLEQLKDMGFYDQQANIRALEATNGNIQLAIERLLSSL